MLHTHKLAQLIMKDRFRSFLIAVTLGFVCSNALAADPGGGVGICYDSLADYMRKTFGAAYEDDENIKSNEVVYHRNKGAGLTRARYYWVYDETPGVNITRTLFEERKANRFCAILQIPLSSGNDFSVKKDGTLPEIVHANDSPPPDFPETRIVFKLDKKYRVYKPESCLAVKGGEVKKIDCKKIFND